MAERMMPVQHRARSRDRSDQRRPTFQVLNAVQPKTHTHGKRDYSHYGVDSSPPHHHPHPGGGNDPSHLQKRLIGVHTIGNKSCESVTSGCRGPACNFTNNFHANSNNNSDARNRSQSASPGELSGRNPPRPRSQSPEDRVVMDEPSDLVVWNPSKKTSRSNLLCPLTDSEFRNINVMDTKTIMKAHGGRARARSNSVPANHHQSRHLQARPPELLLNDMDMCKEASELLDDFVPPPMSPMQVSPSASLASTAYSMQMTLVTQQLEEIQVAQNDVLKHLGEEISRVTEENERLKQEVDHVRGQNQSLVQVVSETTDELERMKQIFRTRGLAHPQPDFNQQDMMILPSAPQHQQRIHQRSNKHQRHGGKRDSVNSNNSHNKSSMGDGDPAMAHMLNGGTGESSYMKPESAEVAPSCKQPKGRKQERNKQQHQLIQQQDRSEDMMANVSQDDMMNDDNMSYLSTDSHANVKGSSRRRSGDHNHRHSHNHSHSNGHNQQPRRRSRSKERHQQKSPRSSSCYEQEGKTTTRPIYQDDCNDEIEIQQSKGSGGCLRVFTCCWSSSGNRPRTDSVDDMVLRGCSEDK